MQNTLAGLVFLILGDSHFASQNFLITTLHDDLMRRGARVATFGACGAPASIFLEARIASCGTAERVGSGAVQVRRPPQGRTTPIGDLVRQHRPNMVVVGMGDTMAGYIHRTMPREEIREQVTALTAEIRALNLPCIWIGPSWGSEGGPFLKTFDRVREMNEFLSTVVAPCTYVDSTRLSRPGQWPTFDGQHYTVDGYRAYGQALGQAITAIPAVQQLVRR